MAAHCSQQNDGQRLASRARRSDARIDGTRVAARETFSRRHCHRGGDRRRRPIPRNHSRWILASAKGRDERLRSQYCTRASKTPFAKETGQGPARDRVPSCKDATNVDLLPLFKGLFDKSRTTSHRNGGKGKYVPKRRQDGSRVGLKGEPRKYSPFQQLRRKY